MTILLQNSSSKVSPIWGIGMMIILLAIVVLMVASIWMMFVKAGKPGWACLVPLYNIIVWLSIIGRPWWYLFFLVFPVTAVILWAIIVFGTARSFNRSILFVLGVTFLPFIFIPVLGFSSSDYIGGMGPSYRRGPKLPQQA
jgi:hypothetical protein